MRPQSPSLLSLLTCSLVVGGLSIGCTETDGKPGTDAGGGSGTTGTTAGEGEEENPYEEGCILVDGAGGYRWINDAIEVASDGSVIELCASSEMHEESVFIDKAVSIVGPGPENFMLAPPTNENGIVVVSSGASVSGMTIYTTRSGVVVGESGGAEVSGVTVADITVYDAPNWGISVDSASDVTISGVELGANVYGGISIDESTVLVEQSLIQGNFGYGIYATNGSEAAIASTEVIGTQLSEEDVFDDGHGVYASGGSLIATENSYFYGNTFVNVFADESDLQMSGDQVEGALYGVVGLNGDSQLSGVSISDGAFHAAFLISNGSVSVDGSVVTGDPSVVVATPASEWNVTDTAGNTPIAGAGMVIQSPDIQVSDSTVVGYNNAGMMLIAPDGGTAALVRVSLQDNGQHGLYAVGHQVTMEDVDITGVFELSEVLPDEACTLVDRYGGAIFVEGTAIWNGGSISGNMGYGASGISTAMNISGVEVSANKCGGILSFGGDLTASGNVFESSVPEDVTYDALASNVVLYQSVSASVTGNSFRNNQRESDRQTSVYDAGSYLYYYVYHQHAGADLYVYASGPTEISSNSFEDGVIGIQSYDTELAISNNTWTNYFGSAISTSGEVDTEVADNEFTDVGGYAVNCSSGQVAMEDNVISGGGLYSYTYDYYVDDELSAEYTSNSLSSAIYLYSCSLSMDGDTVSDRASNAVYSYNGSSGATQTIEMFDVVVESVNANELGYAYYGAIFAYAFYGATDFFLEGVQILDVALNHGIEIYNGNLDGTGSLTLVDSEIDGAQESGIYLYGLGASASLDTVTISNTQSAGIYAYSSAAVSMASSTVTASGTSNIVLDSGSFLDLDPATSSTSSDAAEWGLTCGTGSEVSSCSSLLTSGNGEGRHLGCEAFCDEG